MKDKRKSGWSKRTRIVVSAVAAVLVGLVVMQWLDVRARNQPLDRSADRLITAWESGNDNRIYSLMMSEEMEIPGMSQETLKRFNDWTRECYQDYSPFQRVADVQDDPFAVGMGGDMFVSGSSYESGGKRSAPIGFLIYRTDDGPRAFWTEGAVFSCLVTKYGLVHLTGKSLWLELANALELEMPVLESTGLGGVLVRGRDVSPKTWDELLTRYKRLAG